MIVSIFCVAVGAILSIVSAFTFWPVQMWYDFYRPIVLFIAGYFGGLAIAWIFFDLAGRFTVSYKKNYTKPSKFAHFLLTSGIAYINNHANIRVKKIGLDKIPNEKFLLVSNHKSKFDPMLTAQALGKYDL